MSNINVPSFSSFSSFSSVSSISSFSSFSSFSSLSAVIRSLDGMWLVRNEPREDEGVRR